MASTFDPHDRASWYFGQMSRQDATDLLMAEKNSGAFLVRDSSTIIGDYVLCVREDTRVSHYIINKTQEGEQVSYKIGDLMFPDLVSLLNFYKLHYLDSTPLIRPAPKRCEKVVAKYDFDGNDPDDLPFRKGEILTIVSKDEEQWWTARNSTNQTGSIPVPYVQKYEEGENITPPSNKTSTQNTDAAPRPRPCLQRKLPAYARVTQTRVPNAYDKTALRLEVGDVIKVTRININGQWDGELNGKVGHFPFTHIEFIENENSVDGEPN